MDEKQFVRAHIHVQGIVQGVGFRPFIFKLAETCSLAGYVLNSTKGVKIEIEGSQARVEQFIKELQTNPPPRAVIEGVVVKKLPCFGYKGFEIKESLKEKERFVSISPDIGICTDCLGELFDPENRRYRYPFTNCTNCGPRFSIIKDIPYDRACTTMSTFNMCKQCQLEYLNPANRRFHAQPNACWVCGPQVKLLDGKGEEIKAYDAVASAALLIKEGAILAVKGLGGFHLACDATNSQAVARLRERKNRVDRPFALMMFNLEQIRKFCRVNRGEAELLLSLRRPIVLLEKLEECAEKNSICPEVAPANRYMGVMLPYTPLHYLLLEILKIPLVMTSGNASEEPIAYRDEDAIFRLVKIADAFLIHNREIQIRVDDSVIRFVENRPLLVRRSRGYAPQPLRMGDTAKNVVLGVGGHVKNTFCFLKQNNAILSHHIGDLENLDAISAFEEGIEHYKKIFYLEPQIIACDMHPDYASTHFAEKYAQNSSLPLIRVQHHHAHIAALLAEHKINEQVIAVVLDGSGLGTDGCIWGGEFLSADQKEFKRVAHLTYLALPGGEVAVKQPWRMALSYLHAIYGDECTKIACQNFLNLVKLEKIFAVKKLLDKKISCPPTSSAGRLFDAVSAFLGIRGYVNYEGQAAIELEMLAEDKKVKSYPFRIFEEHEGFVIDTLPILEAIVKEKARHVPVSDIATKFHWTVSEMVLHVCLLVKKSCGLNKVGLSGGVFQNALLLKQVNFLLSSTGFKVLLHSDIPPNDGGISLGQAIVASRVRY